MQESRSQNLEVDLEPLKEKSALNVQMWSKSVLSATTRCSFAKDKHEVKVLARY